MISYDQGNRNEAKIAGQSIILICMHILESLPSTLILASTRVLVQKLINGFLYINALTWM